MNNTPNAPGTPPAPARVTKTGVQELLTSDAGRVLDTAVAEHVMRLRYAGSYVHDGPLMETTDGRTVVCPRYSTDIAAAWGVVADIVHRDWTFEMRDDDPPDACWRVRMYANGHDFYGHGWSAPLAICRCALSAVLASSSPVGR